MAGFKKKKNTFYWEQDCVNMRKCEEPLLGISTCNQKYSILLKLSVLKVRIIERTFEVTWGMGIKLFQKSLINMKFLISLIFFGN